ncbi:hypothetical protein [Lactobacillus johnsonii]|uniref:hypothetical protein n=1 Tax=Lactobacillus johnsonii TaxID=33959 RepID=UPI000BA3B3AF|nr:hypothetical protein [Lactobacillus johnsonii]PAB50508.1 hypothetical protein A3P60_02730 [Lactobacillus johnsonii]PAB54331.1 hypothetical protein A3Q05_07400 [Lactobacillus johnsonii]PEG69373.1 hypothetical protein A3Q04_04470 [Lactobacillus johnsonii]
MKKFTLNTKNPLGSPTGLRVALLVITVVVVIIEVKLLPIVMPQVLNGKGNLNILLSPLLLYIIAFSYSLLKWINLNLIHYHEYKSIKKVIQSTQLIDYADKDKISIFGLRQVIAGVKVNYEELNNGNIKISFFANGIKNSERVGSLTERLQEAFGMTVISVNKKLTHTTYLLGDISNNKKEVNNDDF